LRPAPQRNVCLSRPEINTTLFGLSCFSALGEAAKSIAADCYGAAETSRCILFQASLPVPLNMIEQNSGQMLTAQDVRPRYTGELLLRTRPKIYRQIVRLLSEGVSANQICKLCHVTRETVRAVERREAEAISERKNRIIANLGDVAEIGSERMLEKIGKAGLRDATIGTGVAVDKLLALTSQLPGVQEWQS
jgi:hypothetical protein